MAWTKVIGVTANALVWLGVMPWAGRWGFERLAFGMVHSINKYGTICNLNDAH